MTAVGLPDILTHARMGRSQTDLKRALMDAQSELVTGEAEDKFKATGGDHVRLMAMERSVSTLDSRTPLLSMARSRAAATQTALEGVQASTEGMGVRLLQDISSGQINAAEYTAKDARAALGQMLGALNTELSGRHLFAGARQGAPMPDVDTLMRDIETIVKMSAEHQAEVELVPPSAFVDPLAPPPADLAARIDRNLEIYFSQDRAVTLPIDMDLDGVTDTDAAGDIELSFNKLFADGDDPPTPPPVELADGEFLQYAQRGDVAELRLMIRGLAMANAVVEGAGRVADADARFAALDIAGKHMIKATDDITDMQAELGLAETRIEEAQVRTEAQRSTLELARAELIGRDQYETATRITQLETQLQALYALTARTSQLSLLNFMR
jgi:flagellar hook-associated protein 3 FlgL